ncbi:hypothetical protein RQP46_009548 [Phenoliferia psychrophenolica]
MDPSLESFCVLGGEGFVGQAIIQGLLASHPPQRVSSLGLTQRTFSPSNYRFFRTDVTSKSDILASLRLSGATTVFHTVSPHPTASAEARSESMVIAANGINGLRTCALRFGGIFGPGDRQVLPGFIKVYHDGQTSFQMGQNLNLFDFVYISNVVHAHLLAASPHRNRFDQFSQIYLDPSSEGVGVAGEVFVISNGEPARRVLGYEPLVSLEEGIKEAVAAYKTEEQRLQAQKRN